MKTIRDGSGRKSLVPFAFYDRDTSSWRTFQACFFEGWEAFLGSFPTYGTLWNGRLYRLRLFGPSTYENVSGLWATPNASDARGSHGGGQTRSLRTDIYNLKKSGTVPKGIESSWPTPTAMDRFTMNKRKAVKVDAESVSVPRAAHALSLQQAVLMWSQREVSVEEDRLYPTPIARDYKDTPGSAKSGVNPDGSVRSRLDKLPMVVYDQEQTQAGSGELNADFVEWLMGFPLRWTTKEVIGVKRGRRLKFGDDQWGVEPNIPRIISGDTNRQNRIEALGNAVVPQVVASGPFARVVQLEQELHANRLDSEEVVTPKRRTQDSRKHRSSPNQKRG